jgi:hypothetical protein
LLDEKADPNVKDGQGQLAVQLASGTGPKEWVPRFSPFSAETPCKLAKTYRDGDHFFDNSLASIAFPLPPRLPTRVIIGWNARFTTFKQSKRNRPAEKEPPRIPETADVFGGWV